MNPEIKAFNKFVQITIDSQDPFLQKVLKYADKYFTQKYKLSSSILILDDGMRFKKDYLINWTYHISTNNNSSLEKLLNLSYLPIRIRIKNNDELLNCVFIDVKFFGLARKVNFTLRKQSYLAMRYIKQNMREFITSSTALEITMNACLPGFYESLMNMSANKTISNVRLYFIYENNHSYLTSNEKKLKDACNTLNCNNYDSLDVIKASYINLIKRYHPDKVYGKDEITIRDYNNKFLEIKEAFEFIRLNFQYI